MLLFSYEYDENLNNLIYNIIQNLKNCDIITCSDDKTIKIIKLIGEDKYQIKQTIQNIMKFIKLLK